MAYNVQIAVDAQHALIVTQQVNDEGTDNRSLQRMAEAAQAAVGQPGESIHVVADGGFSNGEQAEACETLGIIVHAPAQRGVNNRGDGTLFSRTDLNMTKAAIRSSVQRASTCTVTSENRSSSCMPVNRKSAERVH